MNILGWERKDARWWKEGWICFGVLEVVENLQKKKIVEKKNK